MTVVSAGWWNRRGHGCLAYLLTVAALALGTTSLRANAEILDFESLPYPTTVVDAAGWGIASDPLGSYMGFKFTSHNYVQGGSQYTNVWLDYALTEFPDYQYGFPYGINGVRALGVLVGQTTFPCTYDIEREDGAEWMFEGAQFSPVYFDNLDVTWTRIVGWRDGAMVYDISTHLIQEAQVFFGSSLEAVAVDKVVLTHRWFLTNGQQRSRPFTMDDMHYQLVPAPGALVLLSMCGLLRQRRRA